MNKKRLFVLLIAILVGFTFSLTNLIIYQNAKTDPNVFFTVFSGGDQDTYAAQIREVYEGKFFSGDAYNYEVKSKLPIFPWIPPLALGLFSKLFKSVEPVFILGDFFLTAIIFILIFKFVYLVSKHYWGAILAGLSTLFLYHLTTKIPPITVKMAQELWNIITLKEPFSLAFNRLTSPQFTFIFLLLFIISLYKSLIKKHKLWPIITGIFSGLLAYIYFYHWTASLVILSICLSFNFLSKSKLVLKRLITALLLALIISSGYLFQILSPGLIDKQISEGRVNGHFIEPLTTLRYGIFSLIIFYILPRGSLRQLLLSIFLSAIALMNLQLITGFTMDPGHWPNSTFEPLVVISGFILILVNLKRFRLQRLASKAWLLILPIFIYAGLNQVALAQRYKSLYLMTSKEQALYSWLNKNTSQESVVLSLNKLTTRRLPALTHNNPYLPYGSYSQIGTKQIWERVNIAFSLFQFNNQAVLEKLFDSQFTGYLFVQTYRYNQRSELIGLDFPIEIKSKIFKTSPVFSSGLLYIPDNIKEANIQQVNFLKQQSLKKRICRYQLDYIIVDQFDKHLMEQPLDETVFQLVFQEQDIFLYQINPNLCQHSI